MSRRSFLALAAAASAAPAAAKKRKIPVGLELYSVRDQLKQDLMGTVVAVAKMGYEGVEFYAPYFDWTPGDAKQDWKVIQDIAKSLGRDKGFTFQNPGEIFDELRAASAGGVADYSGITYQKIEEDKGVFWPCPATDAEGRAIDHRGTPRLFEPGSWNPIAKGAGPFYFPDGKAHFNVAPYSPPTEEVDDEFPLMLTTGRGRLALYMPS